MKQWQKIVFATVSVGGLLYQIYLGFTTHFSNGYSTLVCYLLFSILALSKFTKHPL